MKDISRRLAGIDKRLASSFGVPEPGPHMSPPMWNLVLTILSQNTTDASRDKAFDALKKKYPTFAKLAAASSKELADTIRPAGLSQAKSAYILAALARIKKERGGYTLNFLKSMSLQEARDYITSFEGVGVKTANILLLFSFGFPAFPVDTHVFRVVKRLGLVPSTASPEKAAALLEPYIPDNAHMRLHLNIIRLGRKICRSRNPLCPSCPLLKSCPSGANPENFK